MILLIENSSTVRIRTIITVAYVTFPHYNLYITQTSSFSCILELLF
jgi:hypothetical protein